MDLKFIKIIQKLFCKKILRDRLRSTESIQTEVYAITPLTTHVKGVNKSCFICHQPIMYLFPWQQPLASFPLLAYGLWWSYFTQNMRVQWGLFWWLSTRLLTPVYGPLTRYVKSRAAHVPGMPGSSHFKGNHGLTHWPQGDFNEILDNGFSSWF